VLADIREGSFAYEWIEEMDRGEHRLNALREAAAEERIEKVGRELRSLMRRDVGEPEPRPA
jgi:ketol-acid reductoisomerase